MYFIYRLKNQIYDCHFAPSADHEHIRMIYTNFTNRHKAHVQSLSVPDLARHVVLVDRRLLQEHMEASLVLR